MAINKSYGAKRTGFGRFIGLIVLALAIFFSLIVPLVAEIMIYADPSPTVPGGWSLWTSGTIAFFMIALNIIVLPVITFLFLRFAEGLKGRSLFKAFFLMELAYILTIFIIIQVTPLVLPKFSSRSVSIISHSLTKVKSYSNSYYSYDYPSNFFVTSLHDANSCTTVGNINPKGSSMQVYPRSDTIVQVCFFNDPMPLFFPYAIGSSDNATIKTYTSPQGYEGIRGQQATEIGIQENVFLRRDANTYASIELQIGDQQLFDQILSTFKFTN